MSEDNKIKGITAGSPGPKPGQVFMNTQNGMERVDQPKQEGGSGMTNSRKGIEKHAIAYYRAVKKFEAEDREYNARIKSRSDYNRTYTSEERAEFRLRRGYLRHQVEVTRMSLFQSIEDSPPIGWVKPAEEELNQ